MVPWLVSPITKPVYESSVSVSVLPDESTIVFCDSVVSVSLLLAESTMVFCEAVASSISLCFRETVASLITVVTLTKSN